MRYYWFNREEVLQKAKEKYGNSGDKEKAADYYRSNKDVWKEKVRDKYRNLSEEEKEAKKMEIYFLSIRTSEQTLKFGEYVVNKKYFHASKEAVALDSVERSRMLVSDKFKHSENDSKYLIANLHDNNVIRPLCIILGQMSGYIKYFDNGRKNMSFLIKDESVYLKYTKIWNKIKKLLNIKFHS